MNIDITKNIIKVLKEAYANPESAWAKDFEEELKNYGDASRNRGSSGKWYNKYFRAVKVGDFYAYGWTVQSGWPSVEPLKKAIKNHIK